MEQETKITLYLDVDDTILESSQAVIDILNERHGINPKKTIKDLKDMGYKSIYKNITPEEVYELYSSDIFFEKVKFNQTFLNFYKNNKEKFNIIIVTKGLPDNLAKKEKFVKKVLGNDIEYIGLPLKYDYEQECHINNLDKSSVNMKHGIQVDDRMGCLVNTNAPVKILIKNNMDVYWNEPELTSNNLYVVNDWAQAIEIILFAYKEHYIFKK